MNVKSNQTKYEVPGKYERCACGVGKVCGGESGNCLKKGQVCNRELIRHSTPTSMK